jgi:hypothetical protein
MRDVNGIHGNSIRHHEADTEKQCVCLRSRLPNIPGYSLIGPSGDVTPES